MMFQSTLLHEERQQSQPPINSRRCFNPRSCTRSDTEQLQGKLRDLVSIHAPARGATNAGLIRIGRKGFQSTLLHEERQVALWDIIEQALFQSTLLHEERLDGASPWHHQYGFNPRSCTRSDTTCTLPCHPQPSFNPRSCTRSD